MAPLPTTTTTRPLDLAAWLAGEWTVQRVIDGGRGTFDGRASFVLDGSELVWRETGTLRLDAYAGPARRTLRLHPPSARTPRWEVRFDDGRPFHDLDLRSGRWTAEHHCGADRYRGLYVVQHADGFTVTWRVTGPGRDDEIVSRYRRRTGCRELCST